MKAKQESPQLVLGLDIGTNSIGWAMLEVNGQDQGRIVGSGVRVYEAGMDGLIEQGKEESRNKARRDARLHRRNLARRARRMGGLWSLLQSSKLLPEGNPEAVLPELDKKLSQTWAEKLGLNTGEKEREKVQFFHIFPYLLRARALDEKLSCHELGRALYHLAQRRGFLSNRKALSKKEEAEKEEKGMKAEISELQGKINESGARTLGEYFSRLNPEEGRIRSKHTSRKMYQEEFVALWNAQTRHYPTILTEELKKKVSHAIFYQRPLKIRKEFIGTCEHEPKRKRAPMALLDAQRFRLLQKVNDLVLTDTSTGEVRKLSPEERTKLLEALETQGDLTFGKIRKLTGLKKAHFNFEAFGERNDDKLIGKRTISTTARLIKIFGEERWKGFSQEQREQIVEDVLSIQSEEAQARRGMEDWGLEGEKAEEFGQLALEDGYCNLSRQALAKLLPLMEKGTPYKTAVKEVYGEPPSEKPLDELPLVTKHFSNLRNPAVTRTLTELRKVVNNVVRQYGKPYETRIELTRGLKKNKEDRKEIWKKNRENEKAREEAVKKILAEMPNLKPSRRDTEKVLLAEECGWHCPYTGKQISMASLLGDHPQFEIEHIIPFPRSLDDSFLNKTLCHVDENRVKGTRTPHEAYANTPKWEEILQRVKDFKGKARGIKLERFEAHGEKLDKLLEEFANRQLPDTAYASRLAMEYLGRLYGGHGGVDVDGNRRVQAGRGQVTAYLRNEWGLNKILNDGGEKSRDDHRHHAVDAICIALTNAGTTKMLSDAASRAASERRRRFGKVNPPWPTFLDDVRSSIEKLVVSHRVNRKVSGPLHEETNYSKPIQGTDGKGKPCEFYRVRKPLGNLSEPEAQDIADPVARQLVLDKLQALGIKEPKKAFSNEANHPCLTTKDGRNIPIHKVRINKKVTTFTVGAGSRERHVTTDSNHHIEVVEVLDKKGKPKWEGCLVSLKDAYDRLKAGLPVVKRDHGEGKRFVFSLAKGETIEIDEEGGKRGLYVVKKLGDNRIWFVDTREARKLTEVGYNSKLIEPLRKLHCQKVLITPLGEVRRAND